MKIVCPYCDKEIEVDFDGDIDATLWNYYGDSGDIEMNIYCEDCEKGFLTSLKTKIEVIGFTTYKTRR